jgi:oligoribonuclease
MIWMDLEMTGLNPEKGAILEIASLVTDRELNILAEGPNLAIRQPEPVMASMEEWSRTHHLESGLIERSAASPYDTRAAEKETLDFLRAYSEPGASPLCGNSIWQDRRFLVKHMPELEAFLHYRNVDVSTIKELARRWYPELPAFQKSKAHLALSDIQESLKELAYYRKHVFRAG